MISSEKCLCFHTVSSLVYKETIQELDIVWIVHPFASLLSFVSLLFSTITCLMSSRSWAMVRHDFFLLTCSATANLQLSSIHDSSNFLLVESTPFRSWLFWFTSLTTFATSAFNILLTSFLRELFGVKAIVAWIYCTLAVAMSCSVWYAAESKAESFWWPPNLRLFLLRPLILCLAGICWLLFGERLVVPHHYHAWWPVPQPEWTWWPERTQRPAPQPEQTQWPAPQLAWPQWRAPQLEQTQWQAPQPECTQ